LENGSFHIIRIASGNGVFHFWPGVPDFKRKQLTNSSYLLVPFQREIPIFTIPKIVYNID
jgi:hypothetical protein